MVVLLFRPDLPFHLTSCSFHSFPLNNLFCSFLSIHHIFTYSLTNHIQEPRLWVVWPMGNNFESVNFRLISKQRRWRHLPSLKSLCSLITSHALFLQYVFWRFGALLLWRTALFFEASQNATLYHRKYSIIQASFSLINKDLRIS